jgi:hypothetical protein
MNTTFLLQLDFLHKLIVLCIKELELVGPRLSNYAHKSLGLLEIVLLNLRVQILRNQALRS